MSQETRPQAVTTAQVVCGAILTATAGYAGVGFVLVRMGMIPEDGFAGFEDGGQGLFSIVLIVAGGASAAISFPVRRLLAARVPSEESVVGARTGIAIMSMALAEASGVLGLVYCLLTADLGTSLILWGMAIGAGIFHFPTRSWLEGGAESAGHQGM